MALASMGIYVFDAQALFDALATDAAAPGSSRDFGKDIIPALVAQGQAVAHPFGLSCVKSSPEAPSYWRDVGTVDAYWQANIDLTGTVPELDMYNRDWPVWTYQEQLPPAKFVFNDDGRRGSAVDSLVSGGCIISGAAINRSVLFSKVRVHSYCDVQEAVVLPEVTIGRHCVLRKVVIDHGCEIPDGTRIGVDPQADAQRFHRTPGGVVLVTADMLARL
jgi:glucose-1-phosphate adenylyltransferase